MWFFLKAIYSVQRKIFKFSLKVSHLCHIIVKLSCGVSLADACKTLNLNAECWMANTHLNIFFQSWKEIMWPSRYFMKKSSHSSHSSKETPWNRKLLSETFLKIYFKDREPGSYLFYYSKKNQLHSYMYFIIFYYHGYFGGFSHLSCWAMFACLRWAEIVRIREECGWFSLFLKRIRR